LVTVANLGKVPFHSTKSHLRPSAFFLFITCHLLGEYFDVEIGQPFRLDILREPSDTWASNQPFPRQPRVGLVDAGGNVILNDSSTVVHAYVTPSLAYSSHVVIDTSGGNVPHILSLKFSSDILNSEWNTCGQGDLLPIEVTFSQEVVVVPSPYASAEPGHYLSPPCLN